MKIFVCTLAAMFIVALGTQVRADDAQHAIEAGAPVFAETFNAGDGAALAAYYTENAQLLPPGSDIVEGREAIAAFWQGAMDSGLKLDAVTPVEITQAGDMAVDIGMLALTAPDGAGGTVSLSAKYIVIWQLGDDGVWRLHRDTWNMNP